MRIAIGDIHGCSKTLKRLLEDKIGVSKSDQIYLVGDYIDRGPNSKGVIDYILNLKHEGYQIFPIRGNHEEIFTDAYRDQSMENFQLWLMNGAGDTLESYGIESHHQMGSASLNELPEEHVSFMRELPYYYLLDDFIIVHAGINFEAEEPFKDFQSMVWCRDCLNDKTKSQNRIIVHGHTPIPLSSIHSSELGSSVEQINLDTGCVYKGIIPDMGNLTALDLDTFALYAVENIDF